MPTVEFTSKLSRFFPDLRKVEVSASTIAEAMTELEQQYPGLTSYIIDDGGALRKHVNIFVNGEWLEDRRTLSDPLMPGDTLLVMQALSGG